VDGDQIHPRLMKARAEQRWVQAILGWVRHRETLRSRELEAGAGDGMAHSQAVEVDAERTIVTALQKRLRQWLDEQQRVIGELETEEQRLAAHDRSEKAAVRHRLSVAAGQRATPGEDVRRRLRMAANGNPGTRHRVEEGFGPPADSVAR
jgi:hypothetical protein